MGAGHRDKGNYLNEQSEREREAKYSKTCSWQINTKQKQQEGSKALV